MCQFCSNQKNIKQPKFKLFNINPIPFYIPPRSQQNSTVSSEPTVTPPRSQQNTSVSLEPTDTPPRSQQNSTISSEPTDTSPRSQQNSTASSEPTVTSPRSQQNSTASSEPTVTSPRSQQSPPVSSQPTNTPSRSQQNSTASSEPTVTSPRSQQSPPVSSQPTSTPSRSQQNSTISSKPTNTSSRSQKISIVLLNLPSPSVSQGESKRFKIKQNNSQSISKYQINASKNIKDITNEIQKLLRDYQLIHLPIIIFLEQIHIKGFIMSIGKESITVTGPNLQIKDNSTNKIIQSPNKITIKIKSIQAISNTKKFLIKNNEDQIN
ncbi:MULTISPECIES: hypothetical protein [Bacillus cereus group]|uniref:hypothetical protein n=1 Tax=Bacillus cereus group TaxID=86661 RepID=UPI0020D27553|nr:MULTISPECIES: hypothetical protein [Bacillus cereus group]MDF9528367.1 hypothetical protein [Bacillus cereus]MDG1576473.1 hypothetical protein [Bacillus cereus]MED4446323.1 hypothetical protein [Bacillus cereus]